MSDTTIRYSPRDYRRLCDVCGMLRNISDMHKQDELWVCTYDAGERVRTELDRGNAQQRPFTIKPVPYPKPQNNYYPNLLETDDAAVFNFLAQQVSAQCRYEYVQSGHAVATNLGQALPALSWSARYFYDLIQENDQSRRLVIPKAKELLGTIATYLQTRQQGFGLSPTSTRASDAFYGGFLETGSSTWVTEDAATCGLALLYAYRVLGTLSYRDGARAAASYLRNVQAIGSNGTHYTSNDSAGVGRLYTGSLASEVIAGFYSNSLFYPSALIALEFWNELKTTDGDQSVGSTATPTGFDSIPAKLLSEAITDLRDCWSTGITDSTGTLINGLSSTTPKEFFNAYPATKTGFSLTGTGLWEYADGDTGTQVTSQTFAKALSSLYNYEGATSQVTTISDWLRSFDSNPDFETPSNISTAELYQGTTGTYDPTVSLATLLQVRDPDTLATTAINGSSLYDWGAFGLLSRLWASRNRASFMQSRLYPLNTVQRYYDGNTNDGLTSDRIILRGLSGLTLQTAFSSDANDSGGPVSFTIDTAGGVSTPPLDGLAFWVKGDAGVTASGTDLQRWNDQASLAQDLDVTTAGKELQYGTDTLDGIPGVVGPVSDVINGVPGTRYIARSTNLKALDGKDFGLAPGCHPARTVMAVIIPRNCGIEISGNESFQTGGAVCNFHAQFTSLQSFDCNFFLQAYFNFFEPKFFLYSSFGGVYGPYPVRGPNTLGSVYADTPLLVEWRADYPALAASVNGGGDIPLSPSPLTSDAYDGGLNPAPNGFIVGNGQFGGPAQYQGSIFEILIWDRRLTGATRTDALRYVGTRYPSLSIDLHIAVTNDAVRAAQFGRSFREVRA